MMGIPATEAELIARCRDGDQDAFQQLIKLHHQQVYRVAYAVTANEGDASDIAQETFVKAWQGLGRFRGEAGLATWLTRLALNTARDHLRRQRTRAALHAVRGLLPGQAPPSDPAEVVADRDELQRALDRLSPQARQVVALRYGLDLSLKEIAETLACPEGTVKWRLHAALGRLRALIGHERAPVR
ncbi:MAG: RNA polymerase sigma factor [Chloroflexota bacterium]|nr:RNA polymerase sigma factor [Chloroflexota bacterium]